LLGTTAEILTRGMRRSQSCSFRCPLSTRATIRKSRSWAWRSMEPSRPIRFRSWRGWRVFWMIDWGTGRSGCTLTRPTRPLGWRAERGDGCQVPSATGLPGWRFTRIAWCLKAIRREERQCLTAAQDCSQAEWSCLGGDRVNCILTHSYGYKNQWLCWVTSGSDSAFVSSSPNRLKSSRMQ